MVPSVSADGHRATLRIPAGTQTGVYALQVQLDEPQLFVRTAFLVDIAPESAAPAEFK